MPDYEDAMPDDFSNEVDELGDLRVNFSEKEASAKEGRKPIPRGEYHCKITDLEVKFCGPESKNPGKPYWWLELTVQDGPHENAMVWTNIMLFSGALYSLSSLMAALGYNVDAGEFKVPKGQDLIGRDVNVKVIVKPETDQYDERNEVKRFSEYTGKSPQSGEASLLP
jgi:hypothetical protein